MSFGQRAQANLAKKKKKKYMSADLSNIILIFRNIEVGGGLRKVLHIKLRDTNVVEKKRQQAALPKV